MKARTRGLAGGALVVWLAGCTMLSPASRAMLSPASHAAEELLVKADALAARGEHRAAITAYSEVVGRYPETPAAVRARVLRDALDVVQTLRADVRARDTELRARDTELAAVRRELAGVRGELAAREADLARAQTDLARAQTDLARAQTDVSVRDLELSRLRGEVASRQSDVTRLSAESERLRADLDQLKRIDLRLEQEGAKRR